MQKSFSKKQVLFGDKCVSCMDLYDGARKDLHSDLWVDLKAEISCAQVFD